MSYQLKKLIINSFVGIEKADIDFGKPVSLFVGLNNQGKSSVRDAIRFAFTGKARGIDKFKDVPQLAYNDDTIKMSVELQYLIANEPAIIRRAIRNASKDIIDDHVSLIPYCMDPLLFIELEARQRGSILSKVLGGGLDELVEDAIAEHIGNINKKLLAEIRAAGIDLHDVNALKDAVVSLRRRYKRDAGVSVHEPVFEEYGLADDFDIEGAEKRLVELDKRIAKGSTLIKQAVEANQANAQVQDLKKELKNLNAQIKPIPKITGISSDGLNDLNDCLGIVNRIVGRKMPSAKCPVCDSSSMPLEDWERRRKNLDESFGSILKKVEERNYVEAENQRLTNLINDAGQRLDRARKMAEKYRNAKMPKDAEKLLKELNEQRGQAAAEINNYRLYRTDCEIHKEKLEDIKAAAELVDECNRIDNALKDGGPVKSAIAAGGRTLPINRTLLELWGFGNFEWKDNGDILLNGRPIEQASKSEQYRAAAIMGLALAEVGDVGFAALDEFEVLTGENANRFFDAFYKESGVNNVLVFASSDKDFSKIKRPAWLEVYRAEDGAIEKL